MVCGGMILGVFSSVFCRFRLLGGSELSTWDAWFDDLMRYAEDAYSLLQPVLLAVRPFVNMLLSFSFGLPHDSIFYQCVWIPSTVGKTVKRASVLVHLLQLQRTFASSVCASVMAIFEGILSMDVNRSLQCYLETIS